MRYFQIKLFTEIFMNKYEISLEEVNESHMNFLYELLKKRNNNENISHQKMSSFNQHVKFVNSKPYAKWYIIIQKNEKIGSVYLSLQNEIGIHFLKKMKKPQIWEEIIKRIIKKNKRQTYYINISPRNISLLNFAKKNNFKLMQHTYEIAIKNQKKHEN